MYVVSVSHNDISGILIRLATFSKWSHSAIMFDDDTVIDVTKPTGVRQLTKQQFLTRYPNSDFHYVEVPDEDKARKFALEQLNKPYDMTAIFGIVFQNRRWQDDDKWFCSELVEAVLAAGGKIRFRTVVSSILPRETYAAI